MCKGCFLVCRQCDEASFRVFRFVWSVCRKTQCLCVFFYIRLSHRRQANQTQIMTRYAFLIAYKHIVFSMYTRDINTAEHTQATTPTTIKRYRNGMTIVRINHVEKFHRELFPLWRSSWQMFANHTDRHKSLARHARLINCAAGVFIARYLLNAHFLQFNYIGIVQ